MKLSLVIELLLIFVLLAFAASKSVKHRNQKRKAIQTRQEIETQTDPLEESNINKYCKCSEAFCNCCRDFQIPLLSLDGPGCASLMYLNGDRMAISLSFGKKVITNRTLSSKKPSPVCMPLPGGLSKFCGRVYNIARSGEEFRACLGLELQSKSTVEAAVRVSCFKFGPRGVSSEPADPLPLVPQDEKVDAEDEDDDDDDDDDDYGLGVTDDDDDDDDEDDDDDDDDDESPLDAVNDVESPDYSGFSLLGEDLLGDLFGSTGGKKSSNKNKKKQAPLPSTTTTRRPSRRTTTQKATTQKIVPVRSTTLRTRPATGRPSRRPTRRPGNRRRTTTASTPIDSGVFYSAVTTTTAPLPMVTPDRVQIITSNNEPLEPVVILTQRPISSLSVTTSKSVTNFDNAELEMSLAHITGQLSSMPDTPIVQNDAKESEMATISDSDEEKVTYQKVETITPKMPSTFMYFTSSEKDSNNDLVQIVDSLDSKSEEESEKTGSSAEETRAFEIISPSTGYVVPGDYYEGLRLPKKNDDGFDYRDLDVIGLTEIGESVGDHLGLFGGRHKRHHGNEDTKIKDENNEDDDDYDVFGLETLGDAMDFRKRKDSKRKNRRRQNKMMQGDWSQV